MPTLQWEFFPALTVLPLKHGFSLRYPRKPNQAAKEEHLLRPSLKALGLDESIPIVTAGQPHGDGIAVVKNKNQLFFPQADGLLTDLSNLLLCIRVADCAALYIYDPHSTAIGLVHAGKKGTHLEIVRKALRQMTHVFGSKPSELIVQISPCIRFPHYEIDFLSDIIHQLHSEGVEQIFDAGSCTACNLDRYFSYRAEKGNTGRMWAVFLKQPL